MGLGGIKLAEYADPRAVSRGVGIAAHAASIADRRVRRRDDASVITGRVASASGVADYFNVDVVFADFESRIKTMTVIARRRALRKACASTAWR